MKEWDYIVVGAGSAGCAVAYELAMRSKENRVLVLEAGGWDRSLWIRFAAAQTRAIVGHDWGYRSEPDPSRLGAVDRWLRGRVIGGSSSINGTMYVRGAAVDFNRWAAATNCASMSWAADKVFALYRELESSDQPGALRGHDGPLSVKTVRRPHALTSAFLESAVECGYPRNDDYNGATQEGVAYAQLTQKRGIRCSAADAFLKPIRSQPNVSIYTNAVVTRIEMEKGQARGVWFSRHGKTECASAGDVVVCAGALNTPKLLMLSGLGDPCELAQLGIQSQMALPGVGKNLREHPILKLVYRTRVPSYNLTEGLGQRIKIAAEFLAHREGIVSNLFEATAFLKSTDREAHPDLQFHFMALGYLEGPDGVIVPARYPSVTVLVNKSRPESQGRVRLASGDPAASPRIECRLLSEPADLRTMMDGVRIARRIAGRGPLSKMIAGETQPGTEVRADPSLEEYVRKNTGLGFHPVGTCRMGIDPDAVVTPDLRVHGTENLWIADASIMPDLISGNTNACCMLIGAKLGRELAGRGRAG